MRASDTAVDDDPLSWLEDDTPQTLAWQRQADANAVEYLRSWPGYDALRRRLAPLVASRLVFAPVPGGGRWFGVSTNGKGPGLTVADEPGGPSRPVLDSGDASLDWFFPSPDGRLVAVGLSEGGGEQSVLRLVETDTGRLLPVQLPFASFCRVAWLPDSESFYYSAGTAPDTENAQKHIWFHRVGDAPPSAPEPIQARVEFCVPQVSSDGRYVTCHPSEVEPRPDYLLDRHGTEGWKPFLRDVDGFFVGFFLGDRFVACTSNGAPRGRVVSIPVTGAADRSSWIELVPETDAVIRFVTHVAGRLAVVSLVDASCRIAVHSLDGTFEHDVPLPEGPRGIDGGAWLQEPVLQADDRRLSFVLSTPTTSGALHVHDVPRRRLTRVREPAIELGDAVVRRVEAPSTDGAAVRAWAVHQAGLDLAQPRPTLIYAYGGWNAAFMPVWPGALAAIVEAGGLLVLSNLRGGGEFGSEFWHGGRCERKQGSFDDLFALAEHLIDTNVTASDRLAVAGASNGGLLAAAALTQRPDLWRAVASIVPVTDLLRFARDPHVAQAIEELGDPADPRLREIIARCSPYHRVTAGVPYPATVVACAGDDVRCPPWHARKLVAALRQATSAKAPIHLRVWPHASHMAHNYDVEQTADWLGFVIEQIGLEPRHGHRSSPLATPLASE